MRRIFFFLLMITPLIAGAQEKKIPVALLDFEISGDTPKSISPVLSGLIRRELLRSERYELLDRGNMESILREQDFVLSENCSSKECAVQIGQLLGVEKMLFGSVGTLGKKTIITLQMADVSTGKIERVENETHVGAIEDLDEPLRRLARRFAETGETPVAKREFTMYVTSGPEGAGVYIEDELKGSTPLTLTLDSGDPLKIIIRAQNYQDWFQEIKPKKGETVIVSAKLLEGQTTVRQEGAAKKKKQIPYIKSRFYWLFMAGFVSPTGKWKSEHEKAALMVETGLYYRIFRRYGAGLLFKTDVFTLNDTVVMSRKYLTQLLVLSEMLEFRYKLYSSVNHDFYTTAAAGLLQWIYKTDEITGTDRKNIHDETGNGFCFFAGAGYRYKYLNFMFCWNHASTYFKPSDFIEVKIGFDAVALSGEFLKKRIPPG